MFGWYSYYSGKLGLICFAVFLIMLIKYRKTFSGGFSYSQRYFFVWICMMLYSVLGFLQQDTYHYAWAYEEMVNNSEAYGVEEFYFWLTQVLPHSFLLWRFVIWGTASTLIIITAKKLELNASVLGYMIPLFFLTQLSITRGCLGLSLMMLCAIIFIQSLEKRKVVLMMLGLAGIGLSVYLHKSMVIFISFLVLAYFLPVNRRTITISLIIFPILYSITLVLFQRFSYFSVLNEEQELLISKYQETTKAAKNIYGIIETVIEKGTLVFFMAMIIKRVLYDKIPSSKAHFFVFKYAYVMIYVSFLFLGQEVSQWICMRSLHAGTFALVLCASHSFDLWEGEKRTSMEKLTFLMMLLCSIWTQYLFMSHYWK